ncbi:MAG: cytochrome P450 [Myxococcota bacterium]
MVHFPEIDLNDPDSFVDGVPHHWFQKLRAEAPLYFHPEADGPGFWCVTKYADLKHVSRDPKLFSSWLGGTNIEDRPPDLLARMRVIMLNMDPPQHVKFRRIVQRGFTPRMVEDMRHHVRELARAIVDRVAEKGECDFVQDLAAELPLQVICEMMGVPQQDRFKIFELSNRLIGFDDPEYSTSEEQGMIASAEMFAYANQLAAERKANPGDDLVSRLINAEVDDESLTELEFSSFFLLLAVAGNETTRTVTSWGMHALMENPEQRERLVRDPSLIPSAVEEILRYAPAVHYFRRTATRDTELRGQQIKQGDKLTIWYPSANRDEEVFENPNAFDVARSPNEHVAFGIGEHFCLGANLARMELQEIFREIVTRLPDMELAAPPRRMRSNFINGCKEMRVRYTPEA